MTRYRGLLVVAAAAVVAVGVLGAAASAALPGGQYEFQPNFEKDVNRDVPSGPNDSGAPRIVPGHGTHRHITVNGHAIGFAGLAFPDQRTADNGNQFSLEPPDQGLCEGNGLVIEPVNDIFAIYDTSGHKLSGTESLTQFFTGQSQIDRSTLTFGPFLSDPRCYYDQDTKRFFMSILQFGADPATGAFEAPSYELLAVSKTSTPTTSPSDWYLLRIETTNDGTNGLPSHPGCPCFGDQPLLGADKYGIYITTNEFSILGPEFNGAQIYAIDKKAAEAGQLVYQYVAGSDGPLQLAEGTAYSLQPATSPSPDSWDTANGGTEFLLSSLDFDATTDNRIALWALTNTSSLDTSTPAVKLSPPAIVASETYGQPPNADQQKGAIPLGNAVGDPENQLATNDDRMNQVVYADGKLWGAVNTVVRTSNGKTSQTDRAGIAYFIVNPSTPTSTTVAGTIANQGYVALGNNDDVLFPSIAVNASGKGVIAFSLAGQHYFPSAAWAPIDENGVGSALYFGAQGVTPADGFTGYAAYGGDGVERWGDYSAAVAGDDGRIWVASEWIPGSFFPTFLANWGTYINGVTP